MNAPAKITGKDLFETQACSRCGGGGEYSWNSMDGSRCYGCNGRGWTYSKKGRAARDAWVAAYTRTVRFADVKVGDKVVVEAYGRHVRTVTESKLDPLNDGRFWRLSFDASDGGLGGYASSPETEIALPVTAEEKRAAYEAIAHMPGALGWPS